MEPGSPPPATLPRLRWQIPPWAMRIVRGGRDGSRCTVWRELAAQTLVEIKSLGDHHALFVGCDYYSLLDLTKPC